MGASGGVSLAGRSYTGLGSGHRVFRALRRPYLESVPALMMASVVMKVFAYGQSSGITGKSWGFPAPGLKSWQNSTLWCWEPQDVNISGHQPQVWSSCWQPLQSNGNSQSSRICFLDKQLKLSHVLAAMTRDFPRIWDSEKPTSWWAYLDQEFL